MPTATELTEKRRLSRTAKGWEGSTEWRVDTADEVAALAATGLPAIGTAYPGAANVKANRIQGEHMGGANGGGAVGWTRVEVTYASEGYGSSSTPVVPVSGKAYAEFEITTQQIQAYNEIDAAGLAVANSKPINNGEGVPVDVPVAALRIVRYYDAASVTGSLVASWLALCGTVNNATVNTPQLMGEGGTLTFAAGQLRYRAPRIEKVGDLIQVTHEMMASPTDHLVRWQPLNPDGTSAGAIVSSRVYRNATWPGL
jgi:hypothetical protein